MFRALKTPDILVTSATLALAGALLIAATAAVAQPADRAARLTDSQYIHAAACAAWAPVAVGDDSLAAWVEAEGRTRLPGVTSRARTARDAAARQARRAAGDDLARQQLAARFAADCGDFAPATLAAARIAAD